MYDYKLSFDLNKYQLNASDDLLNHFKKGDDILLEAVCGAGKTEMLLEIIKEALNANKKVGFACPRKQLLIELYERIKKYFDLETIGLVVGGYKCNEKSNFIFLTCHQLNKYHDFFDLLIIDEVDAFPFCDNIELENDAFLSANQFIYLSATVPRKYKRLVEKNKLYMISNNYRHHLHQMPIPEIIQAKGCMQIIRLINSINRLKNNPLIIYVATIKQGRRIEKMLKLFYKKIKFVSSKNLNEKILQSFRNRDIEILISTTVLERGITLKKLNVIVYQADSWIFDEATLIQICGRVGRDTNYYQGEIIFLVKKISKILLKSQEKVIKYNEMFDL
ncbi:competence protein ComFA [Bacilli bacterium PM5-9]|nr:competence protein ComFA [Bacilli bacterium PM5-9]